MRNYLTIAGKDSRDFGVYISGQGTFSAPEKAYEFYSVPGRNGDVIGNNHKLENIEVSYECFIYSNFNQNIADFRSFLLSIDGYQRLQDSYHPDEYRMAAYVGPFEPEVTARNDAGAFTLTFNCKPQRYLTSGDTVYSWIPNQTQVLTGSQLSLYAPLVDPSFLGWDYKRHQVLEYAYPVTKTIIIGGLPATVIEMEYDYRIPVAEKINVSIDDSTVFSADISAYNMTEGHADLLTGDLTVTAKRVRLPKTGWYNFFSPAPNCFRIDTVPELVNDGLINCTHYTKMAGNRIQPGEMMFYNTGTVIIREPSCANAAEFETFLENNEVYVDIYLTADETYTFTPFVPAFPAIGTFKISDSTNKTAAEFSAKYVVTDNTMSNPTMFPSEPIVRVYGTGSFTMDGVTITVTDCVSYCDIDCGLMDCYEGSTNRNNDVSFSTYDFPKLQPGSNTIVIISGITAVEITPRWWRV